MKKSLFILAILFATQLRAADYYWVGGGGNWSDLNHWRLGSSGGSIPSIVPSSGDNVFFDANSNFGTTSAARTVTLDASGFCNNMTWSNVANSPWLATANAAFRIQVSGNLSLSPTTTYQVVFTFKGATPATLTTNGTVLGQFGMDIDKTGGSLTVTDSLIVPSALTAATTNGVTFTSGTFDIAGKKMLVYGFGSQNNNVRTLQMTNATVIANTGSNSGFKVTGLNKTIHATGSTVTAFGYNTDEGVYNKTTITSGSGPNTIFVTNSTFSSLTFTPGAGYLFSNIGSNNTVDSLIFNGPGGIGYVISPYAVVASNNTIGYVKFAMGGQINGTGNVIGKIECLNAFQVWGNTINTVDSMILAPNRTTRYSGTFNINKYLYVAGAACEAYTEINGDSTAGTVNFAAGAVVDISNVILTGVKATGPVTPVAVNGIDGTGNAGFTITEPSGTGTTLYWIGGSGDWNDKSHWSFTSGGTGGACVPFKSDNVVFDANSGLAGGIVTTSSSSFCNDITWMPGVGATTFNESATASLRVYGYAVLQPSVTMNAILEFYGTAVVTLTTNGGGMGNFSFLVAKTGAGSLTLADNWINTSTTSTISFISGNLSLAGRTVTFRIFVSNNNNTRNLDISNATITANLRWIYLGGNKSITSTGSYLTSHAVFQVNNSTYSVVDLTEVRPDSNNDFYINGSVIGQLTFTSTSATSNARVLTSNTIRRLEYKGAGYLGGSPGNNNIDSLILADSRNYFFTGFNSNIKYLKAQAAPCSGLTEMRGNPTGSLAFASGAVADMANIYMQNMTATGPITPITFSGADAGGNTGWTINSAAGSPRYWIGSSGDWNDPNHWSATSGGAPGACVPTVYDDVYFDAGSSFTAVNKTVTVNNGNAYCRNINWTGAANSPTWSKAAAWTIEVWGDSVIVIPAATFNTSPVTLKGSTPAFLKGAAPAGNFDVRIEKAGGSLTLLNNYNNNQTDFAVVDGTFNAPGLVLNVNSIDNLNLLNVTGMNISNAVITATLWRYSNTVTNHSLNAVNSTINANTFIGTGLQYNIVNVSGILNTSAIINAVAINKLSFTDPNTASAVGINGAGNILGTVDYKGSGGIYGSNVIDTLIFFPGNTYTLNASTNTTINDAWFGSGTPCRATQIVSSSASVNATVTKNSGNVDFDYVRLRRITAAGSATPFIARSHSTDLGNNVNWNIAPYNGAAPIYGLGPDSAVVAGNFPITLRTDGFFGAPGSQYIWNNNSTADTLQVAGPGTYYVSVSFPDGCSISDTIIVTEAIILPVNLISFTGTSVDCQPRLSWKVADAFNFSHFEVEKSIDGYTYTKVADMPLTGAEDYTWTDPSGDNSTSYYRLKMVHIGEADTYSNIVRIKNNCQEPAVKVYPTITDNQVQVILPAGYEHATIQVYNTHGQRMSPLITGTLPGRTVYLQGLPKGAYVLQVINGNERKSFTIIKQ